MMLAEAGQRDLEGRSGISIMSDKDRYELEIAGLLQRLREGGPLQCTSWTRRPSWKQS